MTLLTYFLMTMLTSSSIFITQFQDIFDNTFSCNGLEMFIHKFLAVHITVVPAHHIIYYWYYDSNKWFLDPCYMAEIRVLLNKNYANITFS